MEGPVLMLSGRLVREISAALVVNGALVSPVVMETGNAVVEERASTGPYFWRNPV